MKLGEKWMGENLLNIGSLFGVIDQNLSEKINSMSITAFKHLRNRLGFLTLELTNLLVGHCDLH